MKLPQLANPDNLLDLLARNGLHATAAGKAQLYAKAASMLGAADGTEATGLFVPGRIEVLGKHTDYAGGSSIVTAVDRGFCLVAVPSGDHTIEVMTDIEKPTSFMMSPDLSPTVGDWSNYPMTVARRLVRNFGPDLKGARIAFISDLPPASGMSSSSALMIAIAMALIAVNKLDQTELYKRNIPDRISLAGYLATVENGLSHGELTGDRGVGTFGGSEDHTAILNSRPGRLGQYAYSPTRHEAWFDIPDDMIFAIAYSGVQAQKTGPVREKYNNLSLMTRAICDAWIANGNPRLPHIGAILASAPDAQARLEQCLATFESSYPRADLEKRLAAFVEENCRIIPAAGAALKAGDFKRFGEVVDRSQDATEKLLGNQIPETIFLAREARKLGAIAASAFGAGFGGSVWALVKRSEGDSFVQRWMRAYSAEYPEEAMTAHGFLTGPGPAAFELR